MLGFSLHGRQTKYSRNDPNPVASAANPLGSFTRFYDGDPEFCAQFSVSGYRQNADSAGNCAGDVVKRNDVGTPTTTPIYIGDMYSPWNMAALFYTEANGNQDVATELKTVLNLTDTTGTCLTEEEIEKCLAKMILPRNSDPDELFGFMQAPIGYRKYGIRFDVEIGSPCDFGGYFTLGIAQIRQRVCPDFIDLTPDAKDVVTCTTDCTTYTCAKCKDLVGNGIVKQRGLVAETLELDLGPYCEASIDMADLGLYWTHTFIFNRPSETYTTNQAHCTFNPYLMAEFSPPIGKKRPPEKLLAATFNNNGHTAYGLSGGFVFNFLQTIEFGLDVGFSRFSQELYENIPVPTQEFQQGILPRKADARIKPGTNWSCAATMVAHHFDYHFTASVEFRLVHHCSDDISILRTRPLSWATGSFPVSNVDVGKMIEESSWSSSFVNFGLTYDITPHVALGFFAQLPVRQRLAYRSTTAMGSVIFTF